MIPKGRFESTQKLCPWQQSESTHLGCKTTKQTKCIYERNVGQQGLKQPDDFKGTTSRYCSVELLHVTNCDKCDLRCVIMTVCEFKGWIFFFLCQQQVYKHIHNELLLYECCPKESKTTQYK